MQPETVNPAILIVDNDEPTRRLFRRMLERGGFTIADAATGKEAIAMAGATAYDLVIADPVTGEAEGIEMITELRRLCPELKIIAISGMTGASDCLALAAALGVNGALLKPLSQRTLLQAVQNVLNER